MNGYDLFCGLGNFSLPIARFAERVVGVEGNLQMVATAYQNARHNKLDNVAFYANDLQGSLVDAPWRLEPFDKVLLDPPRVGALEVLPLIDAVGARQIVYVSCDPATLARDVGELVKRYHFRLAAVGILDMFPQTTHIEAIACLQR